MSMLPTDIGLPPKFWRFYPEQIDTAIQIAASDKRFFIDAAPTGFGKSLMYMAVAKLLGARTMVLTSNKGLQQQLLVDFSTIGLTDMRGQSNYPCKALSDKKGYHGCDKGPCHYGAVCELHPRFEHYKAGCGFYDALKSARDSSLVVTNYDFWMAANRYMDPGVLGRFDLLILDEAHDAPDKLAEFCAVTLTKDECQEYLGCGLPPTEEGTEVWCSWAQMRVPKLRVEVEKAKKHAMSDPDTVKEMTDLLRKLEFMMTAVGGWERSEPSEPTIQMPGVSNDWVAEPVNNGKAACFSPVWAHRYSERFLFCSVPKVLLVSATILPITATYLGVDKGKSEFREHQSGFHPERRPIYIVNGMPSIGMKTGEGEYRQWLAKMEQIAEPREGRNGVIHTVSYKLADLVAWNSAGMKARLDWCKKVKNPYTKWESREPAREVVERFKKATNTGKILVGPSFDTGFDFPYEQCEWQIVAKLPFIDSRPKVVKARAKSDRGYLNYVTALRLVQMCGRGMRAGDDTCETFILDGNAFWFLRAAKDMLPKWFKTAIKWVDGLPKPLAKIDRRPKS